MSLLDLRIGLSSMRYVGLRYRDPICGWRFRRLAPSDEGRPNAWCPWCWSAERHRLLWLYLLRETDIADSRLRLLHLAPERGLGRRLRHRANLDYVSADLASPQAMVKADATDLPFGDDEFDVVVCNHVLEHIEDDRAVMSEFVRVLKPGGRAFMQHPIDHSRAVTIEDPTITSPEARQRLFLQHDHVRIYGRDISDRLQAAGFQVRVVDYLNRVSANDRRRYRLDSAEEDLRADSIYVCRVPDWLTGRGLAPDQAD